MFCVSTPAGDGVSPTPSSGVDGNTVTSVVVSLMAAPAASKPHVNARNCSSFSAASTDVNVAVFALEFARAETPDRLASAVTATMRIAIATSTSSNENPWVQARRRTIVRVTRDRLCNARSTSYRGRNGRFFQGFLQRTKNDERFDRRIYERDDRGTRKECIAATLVSCLRSSFAFGRRCIPPGCRARRSHIPDILPPRALPA